jgi:hypothetical protein
MGARDGLLFAVAAKQGFERANFSFSCFSASTTLLTRAVADTRGIYIDEGFSLHLQIKKLLACRPISLAFG